MEQNVIYACENKKISNQCVEEIKNVNKKLKYFEFDFSKKMFLETISFI